MRAARQSRAHGGRADRGVHEQGEARASDCRGARAVEATRSPSKTELLSHLGAEPILCDVFDREALIQAVRDFKPDVVLNELTDLPDDAAQISELAFEPREPGI